MAADLHYLFVGCDNLIEYDGARRADTGLFLNAATATWALFASEALAIAGTPVLASGALSYVVASNGVYRGTLQSSAYTLVKGTVYWLKLTAAEAGADDTRILRCVAKYHGASDN